MLRHHGGFAIAHFPCHVFHRLSCFTACAHSMTLCDFILSADMITFQKPDDVSELAATYYLFMSHRYTRPPIHPSVFV